MERLKRIEKLVEANAKAIEILSKGIKEMHRERNLLSNLVASLPPIEQSSGYDRIAKNLDDRKRQLDKQQKEITKILEAI